MVYKLFKLYETFSTKISNISKNVSFELHRILIVKLVPTCIHFIHMLHQNQHCWCVRVSHDQMTHAAVSHLRALKFSHYSVIGPQYLIRSSLFSFRYR